MNFYAYEELVEQTAIYPNIGHNFIFTVLGLNGEAGEVAEKLKKIIRDKEGHINYLDRGALVAELGDVLWYLTACARELEVSLNTVAIRNMDKLLSRRDNR